MATDQRSIPDLLGRIARAQKNLVANNPYRLLLKECGVAIVDIARQYQELKNRPTVTVTKIPDAEEMTADA